MSFPSILAIVVTFNPDFRRLVCNLKALSKQVSQVLIVDNCSKSIKVNQVSRQFENVNVLFLDDNYGIGYAQNRGIDYARTNGIQYILLMDQDSVPADDMVKQLCHKLQSMPDAAAVGPVYFSEHQNVHGLKRMSQTADQDRPVAHVGSLIASGCLIPMKVIDSVGGMREDLFIDYVDIEWGLRAQSMGLKSYVIWSAHMSHQLGGYVIRFIGRNIIIHSPLRRYYQYRNAVLLYKMKHISLSWKLNNASRLFLRAIFYILMNKPRLQNFKMILHGLIHGIIGKTGKFK